MLEHSGGGIWAENVPALTAFLTIATQWRCVSTAEGKIRVIGLDYSGAQSGLTLAGVEVTPDLWDGIRLIERGARAEMNGDPA